MDGKPPRFFLSATGQMEHLMRRCLQYAGMADTPTAGNPSVGFCQIDGDYPGAVPTEKIRWGKLNVDTPKFMIPSDATIAAPLVSAYVLDD